MALPDAAFLLLCIETASVTGIDDTYCISVKLFLQSGIEAFLSATVIFSAEQIYFRSTHAKYQFQGILQRMKISDFWTFRQIELPT